MVEHEEQRNAELLKQLGIEESKRILGSLEGQQAHVAVGKCFAKEGLHDEAILLADRILLMSNGPNACIAEIVENTLAKPRERHSIHHDEQYYRIRNHLVDFLVNRSKLYQTGELRRPARPPHVRPGLLEAASARIVNLKH